MPDPEFSRTSLLAILRSGPKKPFTSLEVMLTRFGLLGGVLALIIFSAIKSEAPLQLAGLDSQSLRAEAEELNLQLRLTEISYFKDQSTITALKEAAQNGPGHLNTIIIKNETPALDLKAYDNPEVDKALQVLSE